MLTFLPPPDEPELMLVFDALTHYRNYWRKFSSEAITDSNKEYGLRRAQCAENALNALLP